ncbi:CDP-glycerol glycerophosphotransferase family protein [Weissella uvarum]|nr:CDP-glycerol glycerophosphotransferase family protein [Weissella uvarum]MCM0595411.1 CDP-glycerol glycerophosphotransferase family protein [Weissella uvarum]
MQILLRVLRVFVSIRSKQVMLASYSGRQISDTPWAAFQILKNDPSFANYDFVWAVQHPENFTEMSDVKIVKMNSFSYFWNLLASKYWIANSSIERLLNVKRPEQIYIQFWHGMPMKTLGHAEKDLSWLVQHWYDNVPIDYLFAYCDYDAERLHELFPKTKHLVVQGQLRKWLSQSAAKSPDQQLLGALNSNKPVLLYAPTYRGSDDDTGFLSATELTKLMENYQVIYRGHYFSEHQQLPGLIDGNNYDVYQIFAQADLLITDYSSILFDFAYWQKPIYLYVPDLETYRSERGLALDPATLHLPMARTFDELQQQLAQASCSMEAVANLETTYDPHTTEQTIAALRQIFNENL